MSRRSRYGSNRNRNNTRKERIMMIATSVFVLAAMTLTGVYVKESNKKNEDNGYTIDFSELDEQNPTDEGQDKTVNPETDNKPQQNNNSDSAKASQEQVGTGNNTFSLEDDLDYAPPLRSVDSSHVENSGLTANITSTEENLEASEDMEVAQAADFRELEEMIPTTSDAVQGEVQPKLHFSENDTLAWPIVGNILINYSMDKTVFFPTLQQYKYNPALIIEATEGANITAAANGKVTDVFYNEEIGNAVTMDLGDGYALTYGQLDDIQVSKGAYVETGEMIGTVAAPTKYYSVEGCNAYFMLTKEGKAINPMTLLGAGN